MKSTKIFRGIERMIAMPISEKARRKDHEKFWKEIKKSLARDRKRK